MSTLFDGAEDAIFLSDGACFVDCNPATLGMFGCKSKRDVIGKTPAALSPPRQPDGSSSAEAAERRIRAALAGARQHFEWRHWRLDHTEFDVEVRLSRCLLRGQPFLVGVVRDITARVRAEAALSRKSKHDALISGTMMRFVLDGGHPNIDELVRLSLDELAAFLGADHAYLFFSTPDRTTYSCTHEIHAAHVTPLKSRYQAAAAGTDPFIEQTLLEGKVVRTRPQGEGEGSVLHVPTAGTHECAAMIGLASHGRAIEWTEQDVVTCTTVGMILTCAAQRRAAHDRLLREKELSDAIIESLPGIFYLYDADLRLRRWNKSVESMGYEPKELYGTFLGDWLLTDEERSAAIATAQNLLRFGGPPEVVETEVRYKDGRVLPYLCSAVRLNTPAGSSIVGVGFDITPLVEARKGLEASERKYRDIFNAPNEAFFIHDAEGRVIDVNDRACAMFGIDPASAKELTIGDLSLGVPPYSQAEAVEKIALAERDGGQVFEWRSMRRDGTTFWSEISLRGFTSGGEGRVIASVRDVTGRLEAAHERERLIEQVQATSATKDQFLAVLSHELRNPLAAIQAGVGLIRHLTSSGEPRISEALDIVERNVKMQARMVNDLLDLSRLVRGKLTLQRSVVEVGGIVHAAIQGCRADAARAGVALEVHAESGLCVDADGDRVQQMIINLVDNAIKFTPKGGRTTVTVSEVDGRCRIVVEDNGVGIEPGRITELFEMFRQGGVAARRASGLGIGLALVKSIAELHEGRVWAESAGEGRGSRFIVELPSAPAPRKRAASDETARVEPRTKMLLVEDNADTRVLLAETLDELGYEVTAAPSAEQALEILRRENSFAVILSDIGLPGMNGYDLLVEARRLPSAANAIAFALTGYGQEGDIRHAHDVGYVDHFVKPVRIDEIDRRVRARLAER